MNNTLQQAMSLLNLGEFSKVVDICIKNQSQHPSFELMLAVAYGKLEEYKKSFALFKSLQNRFPNNPDIPFNHALIAKQQDNIEDASEYFRKCLGINKNYHPAEHALGNINLSLGATETALIHFEAALKKNPGNPDYTRSLARILLSLGHYRRGLEHITPLTNGANAQAPDLQLKLEALYRLKCTVEARELYKTALAIFPQNAPILFFAGLVEIDEKKFVLAETLLQRASLDNSFGKDNFDLEANTTFCRFMQSGDVLELEKIKLLINEKSTEQAFIFICNVFETYGDTAQAQLYAQKGLQQYPNSSELQRLEARVFLRLGEVNKALDILLYLAEQEEETPSLNFYELAKCYESLGNYEFAAKYIIKANESETKAEKVEIEENKFLAELKPISSMLETTKCNGNQAVNNYKFVFIVGFPRSGTTLLESRIANGQNVTVLEETNAMKDLYAQVSQYSGGLNIVEYLNNCSQAELNKFADEYFQQLSEYASVSKECIVVDKMPMNGLYTLLIKKLFPQSKIVLAIRDPRDICISSLKQAMVKLHSVESFALHYDQYFELLYSIERDYPGTFIKIKYEELINDFDSQFAQLLETLSMKIAQQDITDSGNTRLFNTPSYHQVVKPIYKDAIKAFKHYQSFFDLNNPNLQKWVSKLGY